MGYMKKYGRFEALVKNLEKYLGKILLSRHIPLKTTYFENKVVHK